MAVGGRTYGRKYGRVYGRVFVRKVWFDGGNTVASAPVVLQSVTVSPNNDVRANDNFFVLSVL